MLVPVFPPELCQNILDLCYDRRSLSACSLTCRAWEKWARRRLFEAVKLTKVDHCLSFVAILKSSVSAGTNIRDYVRTVSFSSYGYARPKWRDAARWAFRHLPNIVSLHLTFCNYNELVAWASCDEQVDINAASRSIGSLFSSSKISSLSISWVSFKSWEDFWTLCTCFPCLTRLELGDMEFDQPLDLENPVLEVKPNDTASMHALTTIKSLVVVSGVQNTAIVLCGLSRYPFELRLRQVDCICAGGDPRMFDLIMSSEQSLEYLHLTFWNDSFLREGDLTKHTRLNTLVLGFLFSYFIPGDKPCIALPTFLSRLNVGCMRELVVCVELPVRPAGSMCWGFFDWSALDSSLAVLAKNRPALRVTFDLSLTLLGGAASPDTFGPLASQLRKSLLMGLKIKVVARHGPSKRRHSDDTVKTCWLSVTPRSLV